MGAWVVLIMIVLAGCGAVARSSASQSDPTGTGQAIPIGSSSHGTADKNIPYQGGEGDGVAHIDGPAIPALNATWRGIDHCAAPVITTAGVVTISTATCPAGRTVELVTIAGAGHQWPGAIPDRLAQILLHTDPPSTALNATQVIWQFFAAHAR